MLPNYCIEIYLYLLPKDAYISKVIKRNKWQSVLMLTLLKE
ncbi:MAG: hypothetical protein ANABAC_1427 [Anaerolineae bacterium]|nr:MAG: hypothetical protein ANABAC_1427 [Anaerolineae bacterium]